MTFVSELKPQALWQHFDKILTIPRGSKNEQAMAEYVISVAQKHNLSYKTDQVGNIVVSKSATSGKENAPIVILQSHLDMVNEKNADVDHNFSKDPLKPRQEDGYLYATGTTLGSDNGIGVAAALAVMGSSDVQHGPMEFLFTIDEETGMTGASALSTDFLQGRCLLNMDTEEEGSLYVGCAGGAGVDIKLDHQYENLPAGFEGLAIKLHGLKGGHSGVDIHLQRGNAVKLLVRALVATKKDFHFKLGNIIGGNMHNAIPREAFATLAVSSSDRKALEAKLREEFQAFYAEFKLAEPTMKLDVSSENLKSVLTEASGTQTLNLLNSLPHGIMAMSYDIPDLVETSVNVASVKLNGSELTIHLSTRSSIDSAIQAIQNRVISIGELAGGKVKELEGYPGWKPNLESKTLQAAKAAHIEILKKEPGIKAIHAGLECGLIGEKYDGMDMVSLGPQIEFPHSPDERVRIGSVADFYKLLIGTLERMA